MRDLPSQSEFETWKVAVDGDNVPSALLGFVNSLAATAASTSSLDGLCPDGEWNPEALADAVGEFWCERLLKGALQKAFEATTDPRSFGRYLERAFRNMLIDARRARGEPRLRARLHAILLSNGDGRFRKVAGSSASGEEIWSLATDGGPEPVRYADGEASLLSHLHAIGLEETIQTSEGRADVVVSNEELSRLLTDLFGRVEASLSLDEIAAAFRQRFVTHYLPPRVGDDETIGEVEDPEAADLAELVDARRLAAQALVQLTSRQTSVLLERHHHSRTLDEIASAHDCSRGTADNELRRANEVIRQFACPDDITQIWKAMLDLSFQGVEMLGESVNDD